MEKHKNWIITVVVVIVVAIGVQFARFHAITSKLSNNMGALIPKNYFPFNGTWMKDANGQIKKA